MGRKKANEYHTHKFGINLSDDDFEKLKQEVAKSTCWSMSEFGRRILMGKPITIFYRNQSLDEFIQEAIMLRKDLQQLTFKDDRLRPLLEEIKSCINKIYDHVRENKSKQEYKRHPILSRKEGTAEDGGVSDSS